MRYEHLAGLCEELHGGGVVDAKRNRHLQIELNKWVNQVDLAEAASLLEHLSSGTVAVYALSALQSALIRQAATVPAKELSELRGRLVVLLNRGRLEGYTLIKVAKLVALVLFHELWMADDALAATLTQIESPSSKLDFSRIFIEDFLAAESLGPEHRRHIYQCLYSSSNFVLEPLLLALRQLRPGCATSASGIKLLGSVINVYALDLGQLPESIELTLKYVTEPSPETVELVVLCIESLTEVVSVAQYHGRSKAAMIYLVTGEYGCFRRSDSARQVYGRVLGAMFSMVAQIVDSDAVLNSSFLSWGGASEFMPRVVHFVRSFMANHYTTYALLKRANAVGLADIRSPIELLEIFFKLTFWQKQAEAIEACLDIWDDFLDQLQVMHESKMATEAERGQYTRLLVSLFDQSQASGFGETKLQVYQIKKDTFIVKTRISELEWEVTILTKKVSK